MGEGTSIDEDLPADVRRCLDDYLRHSATVMAAELGGPLPAAEFDTLDIFPTGRSGRVQPRIEPSTSSAIEVTGSRRSARQRFVSPDTIHRAIPVTAKIAAMMPSVTSWCGIGNRRYRDISATSATISVISARPPATSAAIFQNEYGARPITQPASWPCTTARCGEPR